MLWQPVLEFVISVLGSDKIFFAADYPYESSREAVEFIKTVPINQQDKEAICYKNAQRLFGL